MVSVIVSRCFIAFIRVNMRNHYMYILPLNLDIIVEENLGVVKISVKRINRSERLAVDCNFPPSHQKVAEHQTEMFG